MKQSFDSKLSEMLGSFEPSVDSSLKSKLFKMERRRIKRAAYWRAVSSVLIIGLLTLAYSIFPTENSDQRNTKVVTSTTSKSPVSLVESKKEVNNAKNIGDSNQVIISKAEPTKEVQIWKKHQLEIPNFLLVGKGIPLNAELKNDITPFQLPSVAREKDALPKPNQAKAHYIFGAHFLYRRIVPNSQDQLVVKSLGENRTFGLNRLGLQFGYGQSIPLNDKLVLRFGSLINLNQQDFTLQAHGDTPESFDAIVGENIQIIPNFATQSISANHLLWSVSFQTGIDLKVLPNKNQSLYSSLEYNAVLNDTHRFGIADDPLVIHYPNKLLIEIGMRNKLITTPGGELYFLPNIRYSLNNSRIAANSLSISPFSIGLGLNYSLSRTN